LENQKFHLYLWCMKENKSIINWEVYSRLKKPTPIIQKELKFYRKPLLGRILDKIRVFVKKMWKKPFFSVLFLGNFLLLLKYVDCTVSGEHVELFRWVTTSTFFVLFGVSIFFDKNQSK
jgi:hypothetical protein